MDAFDADDLIFAAARAHPLGQRVRALLEPGPVERSGPISGIGSVLLLSDLLATPLRDGADDEIAVTYPAHLPDP